MQRQRASGSGSAQHFTASRSRSTIHGNTGNTVFTLYCFLLRGRQWHVRHCTFSSFMSIVLVAAFTWCTLKLLRNYPAHTHTLSADDRFNRPRAHVASRRSDSGYYLFLLQLFSSFPAASDERIAFSSLFFTFLDLFSLTCSLSPPPFFPYFFVFLHFSLSQL